MFYSDKIVMTFLTHVMYFDLKTSIVNLFLFLILLRNYAYVKFRTFNLTFIFISGKTNCNASRFLRLTQNQLSRKSSNFEFARYY